MDRALKERLAGAVVLVLLAVWLIPQVLDGPDDADQRATQTLTLPAPDKETGVRTQTVRLDAKRASPTATKPPEPSKPATADPAPRTPRVTKPSAKPSSAKPAAREEVLAAEGWFVQLGSFSERANASRLADTVADLGFKTEVSKYTAGEAVLHRVRVGPRPTRVAAEALASDLARRGYPGQVVQDG